MAASSASGSAQVLVQCRAFGSFSTLLDTLHSRKSQHSATLVLKPETPPPEAYADMLHGEGMGEEGEEGGRRRQ